MELQANYSWNALWANRTWIISIWLILAVAGVALIFAMPSTYRAEAKLYIRLGRENVTLDSTANLGQGAISAVPITRDGEINSIVELLKTRTLLDHVVTEVGPEVVIDEQQTLIDKWLPSSLNANERALIKLEKMVEIAALRKSNLIRITVDARSPGFALRASQHYLDAFLSEHRRLSRNPDAKEFFVTQTQLSQDQLSDKEAALLALKNQIGAVSIEEQKRLLLAHRASLLQAIETSEADLSAKEAAIVSLKAKRDSRPDRIVTQKTTGLPNVAADSIRDQLYTLELREKELSSKYKSKHPLLLQVRRQLSEAQALHKKEDESRTQVVEAKSKLAEENELALDQHETEIESLQAHISIRKPQLQEVERRLSQINEAETSLAKLERELEFHRNSVANYSKSVEQARIDELLEAQRISNIAVAQPPMVSGRPVSPNRPLLIGLLSIASFLLALASSALASRIRGLSFTPHDPIDLTSLALN